MSTVSEAIAKRSSTRGYTADAISKEELDQLINAGLMAPTGMNRQELHFSVVKGDNPVLAELEDEKNALRGIERAEHNFYYEAPILIVISAESGFKWSHVDAGIAVENMALMAEELGLGNLIIGCIYDALHGEKKEHFSDALDIPEGYEFEISLAVGHKAVTKEPHSYDAKRQVSYLD